MALRARLTPPRETQSNWPWHKVESSSLRASLLFGGERRMEAGSYLQPGFTTRLAIESRAAGWHRLAEVARVWQPSRLKGIQVNPEFGTPFLTATQVFNARPLARKWLSLYRTNDRNKRFVSELTILLTRSGSVGRGALVHSTLEGVLISDDLLRVEANEEDWWGWIYAYLRAPSVREMMKATHYGHIIKHLETQHVAGLPILRLRRTLRAPFGEQASMIIELRNRAHELVNEAEATYENSVGMPPNPDDKTSSFTTIANAMFGRGRRLEANYHNPTARAAEETIRSGCQRLDVVRDLVDRVFVPGRFKHVYGEEGVPYLDSAQILELAPDIDKRVLSLDDERQADYLVTPGTLLIPCSGQLHGIIGSVVMATDWHENKILTNHILRIVPKAAAAIRIGYLQATLSHPLLGRPRLLKNAFGSSVPELSPLDVSVLSVPRLSPATEDEIADRMEEAARLRAQADQLEERIAAEAENHLTQFLSGDQRLVQTCTPAARPLGADLRSAT